MQAVVRPERRILLNTVLLGAGEGAGQLTNLVVVLSLARAFGADVLGQYSVSMSVGAVTALVVGLGTQPLLIREISRDAVASRDLLGVLVPAQFVLGVGAWLMACLVSIALIGEAGATPVIAATCGYQILLRLATTLLAPFQATEKMQSAVAGQLAQRLLTLALALIAVWSGAGPGTVTLTLAVGAGFLIVYAWVAGARRFGRPALVLDWRRAFGLFRRASPFFGLTALGVIYARGGLIMLSALAGPVAVGLYAVVDRFMVAAGLAPGVFNSAAYPALSRLTRHSIADARALAARCLRLMLVGTVPLAAMISIFAEDILRLVFGTEFLRASVALQVLAWTLPLRGAQWLLGSQLAALDRQAAMAKGRSFALIAFLVLTPVLIHTHGFAGIAWAVLACDGLQFALYWRILKREQVAPSLFQPLLPPALAALATLTAGAVAGDLSLASRLLVATACMGGGLWAFGAVRMQDLEFLATLIGRRRGSSPNP